LNKIFVLPPGEDWIVDRWVSEWYVHNSDISVTDPNDADVIWVLADWCWRRIPARMLTDKKIVVTVHHIVPEKMDEAAHAEFSLRDTFVDFYHVPCETTRAQISSMTSKPIVTILPWVNGELWSRDDAGGKLIRDRFAIPPKGKHMLVGSFQRDTEGKDLISPKLEKGPDRFCEVVERLHVSLGGNVSVLLGGWRRQYVIQRLNNAGIKWHYIERPPFDVVRAMYSAIDLYVVAARYEGGPQAVVECAATKTPIISTRVGFASDILAQCSLFDDVNLAVKASPDVDVAYSNVSKLFMPKGFEPFRSFLGGV
jgi:glycosyltransferase involved in cell wall biosynthesis